MVVIQEVFKRLRQVLLKGVALLTRRNKHYVVTANKDLPELYLLVPLYLGIVQPYVYVGIECLEHAHYVIPFLCPYEDPLVL